MPRSTSTPPTLLILLLLFLSSATADPNDAVCLTQLHASLSDPTNRLHNWTLANLATPCGSAGFESRLPGATCNNGRIFKLSLPNLSLSGPLTPFLSNCSNLQSLDLSSNRLSGPIPTEFRLLLNLAVLNLSNNLLSGPIPPDLADCRFLNVLDLHSNLLSGPIPPQLGSLSRLSSFDVSDNRLQGMIPTSLSNRTATVPRFNASSFRGNKKLLGFPLRTYGDGKGLSVFAIVGIGVGSGIASLVVSFTVVCVWLRVSDRRLAFQEPKNSHHLPHY